MILVVDNYDSFVHNLARYLRLEGGETHIVRNDSLSVEAALALAPTAVVISPGPKTPEDAGVSLDLVKNLPSDIPLLGVCLGHQVLVSALGGKTVRAGRPLHGEASAIYHTGQGLFRGIASPTLSGRYHSLISTLEGAHDLRSCAWGPDGAIMAARHRRFPWFGVQFHPESLLTSSGRQMIRNFVRCQKNSMHTEKL